VSAQNYQALETEDIVDLLGVTDRQIRNYIKEKKMPCIGDGRGRRFVWRDVLEWYVSYRMELSGNGGSEDPELAEDGKETMTAALTRKTIAEADLKELQLARERGLVVAVQDVKANIADVAKGIQTKLLGLPSKLVGRIFGMKDKSALKQVLDSECNQLCQELAQIGKLEPTGAGDDEDE
jgi:phage terminase Nu1 subunit (DNA packaging protein)